MPKGKFREYIDYYNLNFKYHLYWVAFGFVPTFDDIVLSNADMNGGEFCPDIFCVTLSFHCNIIASMQRHVVQCHITCSQTMRTLEIVSQ